MITNRIIRHQLLPTLLALLVLTGCSHQETIEQEPSRIDPSQYIEIALDGVSLSEGSTARAVTTAPLPVGSTFRLYAFEQGKSDLLDDLLATRTYTIKEKAGVPVLTEGEAKLAVPTGEIDIYLVGPISHATEFGVTPQMGIDLISSKTTIKVSQAGGAFTVNPLQHKMAKTEVCVTRHTNKQYVNLFVTEITLGAQSTTGIYDFATNQIIPDEEGHELLHITPVDEIEKGIKYQATLFMIPRKERAMTIEVFFTCQQTGSMDIVERRLSSGSLKAELKEGALTRFSTMPELSATTTWRPTLLPWNAKEQADIDVPDPDLLFSYNAWDAPVEIKGKKYWLDRSGNENHAEIIGDMGYDAENHFYYNRSNGSAFQVPPLGKLDQYTLELTVESKQQAQNQGAMFTGNFTNGTFNNRSLNVHIPWGVTTYMDAGDMGARRLPFAFSANDIVFMEIMATYGFQHTGTKMSISRNGVLAKEQTPTPNDFGAFDDNKLWYSNPAAGSNYGCRIYAARLYRTVLSADELKQNSLNDIASFAGVYIDGESYVKSGLVLNLDGTKPGGTAGVWKDQSGNGNDAQIIGTVAHKENSYYYFDGNTSNYMKLIKSLGTLQEYTLELVVMSEQITAGGNSVLCFSSKEKNDQGREINCHLPWWGAYCWQSPLRRNTLNNVIEVDISKLPYPLANDITVGQFATTRTHNQNEGLVSRQNQLVIGSAASTTSLNEMKYCYIGVHPTNNSPYVASPLKGKVYAIRLYNRVLSDKELKVNYDLDKKKYKILN